MKKYTFKEHFAELKSKTMKILIFFLVSFFLCFIFSDYLYQIILHPLIEISTNEQQKIIYTGLTEAFFSYIKISSFFAFVITFPYSSWQIYKFIKPGLKEKETPLIAMLFTLSPILFYIGALFMFYYVMPNAWMFFLSFETTNIGIPLILEAKISEYLDLVIQLTIGFGFTFQLPIVMIILCLMGIVTTNTLKNKRRISVVIIFIIAAIFTPPDILSQIALAIPLILLYEISIILCNFIENRSIK